VRREEARSCNGSSQSRGPYCKGAIILKSISGGNGIVTKLDLRQQTCGQAQEASWRTAHREETEECHHQFVHQCCTKIHHATRYVSEWSG
jgi:hypothetical protein